jgi:hypothetical protein
MPGNPLSVQSKSRRRASHRRCPVVDVNAYQSIATTGPQDRFSFSRRTTFVKGRGCQMEEGTCESGNIKEALVQLLKWLLSIETDNSNRKLESSSPTTQNSKPKTLLSLMPCISCMFPVKKNGCELWTSEPPSFRKLKTQNSRLFSLVCMYVLYGSSIKKSATNLDFETSPL